MLITAYEKMVGNYGRWSVVREIDAETLRRARDIFENYRQRGVILNDSFDDPSWTLSDQTRNVGLTLIPFEGHFHKSAMKWIGCDHRCYQECIKAYIAFNLGEMGLSTLRELCNVFIALANKTCEEAADSKEYVNHIMGLLQIIPGGSEERDYVIEALEERSTRQRKGKQRHLADFKTYLKFNEMLMRFWGTAGKRQKLFYFPLYFWWNLTAILPLRPTEFLLIPRDCLDDDSGKSILTIRRTKLKGGFQKIAYRIAEDYEYKKYVITESLANELRTYLKATAKMRRPKLDTLFLQQPHLEYICIGQNSSSKYYSYSYLKTCLRYFYDEVVESGIARVQLGDTRHIAMANLIISGGSPILCRELAGHVDIDISSHYYTNISSLVECVTLEQYRKTRGGTVDIAGTSRYPLALPEIHSRVAEGWCAAPSVAEGSVSECLKASSGRGHIGDCTYCGHFWPDNPGVRMKFLNHASGKQRVDADAQHLIRMIELVRKGLGHEEDIGTALLRLQRSSNHYGKCLWEKYAREANM